MSRKQKAKVSRAVHEVSIKIISKFDDCIHFSFDASMISMRSRNYMSVNFTYLCAICVIYTTLIPIQNHSALFHPGEYICRKGLHTINAAGGSRGIDKREISLPGFTHYAFVFHRVCNFKG